MYSFSSVVCSREVEQRNESISKEQKGSRFALGQTAHRAKEEMVTQYLPLVRFVAERVHRRLPPGVDLESLIHSGVVGLPKP